VLLCLTDGPRSTKISLTGPVEESRGKEIVCPIEGNHADFEFGAENYAVLE
jgi:hypothetical protein